MQAIYDTYGKDPNFVMISLSVNDELQKVQQFVQKNRMPWTVSVLGDPEKAWAPMLYHVAAYPTLWLIGPDGKTLANGNYVEEIRPTLDLVMQSPPK
jgi:hypothetical protein